MFALAVYLVMPKGKRKNEAPARSVLSRIAEHPVNRIEQLLPWNIDTELTGDSRLMPRSIVKSIRQDGLRTTLTLLERRAVQCWWVS